MIKQYDVAIIGGDLRQIYLAYILQSAGYQVVLFGIHADICSVQLNYASSLQEAMLSSKYILVPIPMSKDRKYITSIANNDKIEIPDFYQYLQPGHIMFGGIIMEPTIQYCNELGIPFYDLMKNENVIIKNAIATAEGTIAEAIVHSTDNLHQSKSLVLGYGKCAKILAKKLKAFDVNVTIAARKKSDLTEANAFGYQSFPINQLNSRIGEFDYIFNTVPSIILNKELLELIPCETTIIDIASAPGGLDYEAAGQLNLNAHLCLGIPGKIAPKASAEILAEEIISIMKERSD